MQDGDRTNQTGVIAPPGGLDAAHRVRSVIVLAGSVRQTPLARSIGRAIIDLPLSDGTSIAGRLLEASARFAARAGLGGLSVRFLVDSESEVPRDHDDRGAVRCVVERDASPIRGVAGVLSDATRGYEPDDYVVVLNGAQVFRDPMEELVGAMLRTGSDVSMVSSVEGTPVGLWLIRCAPLRSVREVGYVDLKEQALPEWRERWKISVVEREHAPAIRTRSVNEYLNAVRMDANGLLSADSAAEDPFREEWQRSFGIVEPGAEVADDALVHDSVILDGAAVERGAVVVRSVVCPGARIGAGERVAGRVVGRGRGGAS